MVGGTPVQIMDFEQSIEQKPWGLLQKIILIYAALAFAVDGWANQVLGVAMPALIHDMGGGKRAAFASVAAAGLAGVALGTVLGGFAGDRFGRRITLIASVFLFGAATLLASQADSVAMLGIIRFVDGLGLGAAIPNGAALVSDFTPLRRRSLAIGFCGTFNPVGGVLAGLAGSFLLPTAGWRVLFMVTGGSALALAALFFFLLPESPAFLASRPHRKLELIRLLSRMGYGFSSDIEFASHKGGAKPSTTVSALFGGEMRRDTLALWAGFFTCLMASYSLFSWLPTMLADRGFGLAQSSISMTGFNTGGIVGGLLGGAAMTAFGMRMPSIAMAIGAAAGAVALGLLHLQPGHGMALTITAFAIEGALVSGLSTALYASAATVYRPFVRATGIGSAAAFGRLGAVASSYTGVIAISVASGSYYFVYVGALMAGCAMAIGLIRFQTSSRIRDGKNAQET